MATSMLMRFSTSMLNTLSEGMEAKQAAELKAQEDAKAKASQIETDLWKIELDINKHHRTTMMSNPNNYVNAEGVTLKAAYPELFAEGYFNPDNMKTFQQVRGMNALFELFSPIPKADEKTVKGYEALLNKVADRTDSEAKYRKILEEGPDKHSVPKFWKNYSQTDEWKKLLADAGGSEEGYLKAFQMYNSFKKVKDESKDSENKDLHTMFPDLNLSNSYSYPKQTTNTINSAYTNLSSLDNMFLTDWDAFRTDWENQNPEGKKTMLTGIMAEIGEQAKRYTSFFKSNIPSYDKEMDRQAYLASRRLLKGDMLKNLYDNVKNLDDDQLQPIIFQIEALDKDSTFSTVAAIEGVFKKNVDMGSHNNSEPNQNRFTGIMDLSEEEKIKFENFATSLGYPADSLDLKNTARQKLFDDNPHATVETFTLASSMFQLQKQNGTLMFASSDPALPTMFANNRGISSLSKVDQQTLGYWIGSQKNEYSDEEIAIALGLISSYHTKAKSSGPTVGSNSNTEDLRSTVRNLLDAINWVNPDDSSYIKVIEQVKNDPKGAYSTAQTLVNASYDLGIEIEDKVNLYLDQIADLPQTQTGLAQWTSNLFANLFGADGSQLSQFQNTFGGDNVMGMTAAKFQSTIMEKGELRNKNGELRYGSTLEYMNDYVEKAVGNEQGQVAYALGRAAAIRMYVAYKLAKYFDPAGRISDKDLKNQLDSFFGDSANVSIEATTGMLTGAVDIVRDRQQVLELVKSDAGLVLDDGRINKQLVNKINGVRHFKTMMQDNGFRLAIRFQNKYTPIRGSDIIQDTLQVTDQGHKIYQLMNKDGTGRLDGAPVFGVYYSSDNSQNPWNGTWTYVPSANMTGTAATSSKEEQPETDTMYLHYEGNTYFTQDKKGTVTGVYVKENDKYKIQKNEDGTNDFSLLY